MPASPAGPARPGPPGSGRPPRPRPGRPAPVPAAVPGTPEGAEQLLAIVDEQQVHRLDPLSLGQGSRGPPPAVETAGWCQAGGPACPDQSCDRPRARSTRRTRPPEPQGRSHRREGSPSGALWWGRWVVGQVCAGSAPGRPWLLLMLPVHPALVDDQSTRCPVTTTIPLHGDHAVVDVRPGDQDAANAVEEWLKDYATSRDPRLRERIILAYLGLADRLAGRFRESRGTTPEDLRQTARAGLIAAVDRYDPGFGNPFIPYAVACVVGELKRHLRDTSWRLHVPRPLKEQ